MVEDVPAVDAKDFFSTVDAFVKARMDVSAIGQALAANRHLSARFNSGVHKMEPLAKGVYGEYQPAPDLTSFVAYSVESDEDPEHIENLRKIFPHEPVSTDLIPVGKSLEQQAKAPTMVSVIGVRFADQNLLTAKAEPAPHRYWSKDNTDTNVPGLDEGITYLPDYDKPKAA